MSTVSRNAWDSERAGVGMIWSIPFSTALSRTDLANHGMVDEASGTATSQATTATATSETSAPPRSSAR